MNWHAVDAVDDAVETTRRFLFPFTLIRWAKLALLVLLMGGGVSTNAPLPIVPEADSAVVGGFGPVADGFLDDAGVIGGSVGAVVTDGGLLTAIIVSLVLVAAVFSVFSLSLRLVFYDALHKSEIRLWRPFISRLRQALGLFAVLTTISIAVTIPVAFAALGAVASESPLGWSLLDSLLSAVTSLSTGPAIALGLAGTGFTLLGILLLRLTYEFVIPTMIVEESGVIAGWKRVWNPLYGNRADVALYLLVHFVIGIGISIFEGFAVVFVGTLVFVVAGVVLLVVAGVLGGIGSLIGTTAGMASVGAVVVVALLAFLLLFLPIRILTRSYLISYEVSVLERLDPSITLFHPNINSAAATPSSSAVSEASEVPESSEVSGASESSEVSESSKP